MLQAVRLRLKDLVMTQGGLFTDVMFQLDDGMMAAHRPMLMARCDMMRAMFSGDFREGSAKIVRYTYPLNIRNGKSQIKTKKNRGSNLDPCGTLYSILIAPKAVVKVIQIFFRIKTKLN